MDWLFRNKTYVWICSYSWFLMELLWLVKELTKFHDVFNTSRSRLFIDVKWRFSFYNFGVSFYSFGVSVQVIIVSNLITSVNLAFLKRIHLIVGFWI